MKAAETYSAFVAALVVALALLAGCTGTHMAPMVHVPLQTRSGQVEGGLVFRPPSPRSEIGGVVRIAATEHLRVGASASGAMRRESNGYAEQETRYRTLFADAYLGLEWSGLLFRLGGLVGSGYGASEVTTARCDDPRVGSACARGERLHARTRYVRSYGQLHAALAPPGPFAVSLALRVPFVVDLASEPSREGATSPELAFTHSLLFRHLRFDLQPMWSRAQGYTLHLALLLRFTPSRR
jgi:hypothetical protein